jgi:hypothetical protein
MTAKSASISPDSGAGSVTHTNAVRYAFNSLDRKYKTNPFTNPNICCANQPTNNNTASQNPNHKSRGNGCNGK